jgi:hypothetical protein
MDCTLRRVAEAMETCIIVMMSTKYEPLGAFLDTLTDDDVTMSFDQIERIIHASLPPSAHTYPEWWSNSSVDGRQNEAWLTHGWVAAGLDLKSRKVKFVRDGAAGAFRKRDRRTPGKAKSAQVVSLQPAPVTATNDIALSFEWQMLGHVVIDVNGGVSFPAVTSDAGLYRLRIDSNDKSQTYIGESTNLRRRFGNYRNPGATQQTSLRINALLKQTIAAGAVVAVDVVTERVKLRINGADVIVDLTSQAMRRMIEHAAIVATDGATIEIANR